MTLADGNAAALHRVRTPLTPATVREAAPLGIDTSLIASTLLLLQEAEHDTPRHTWPRRRQSPTVRRTRSQSPSRRSPKLRHTNGRLHAGADVGDAAQDAEGIRNRESSGLRLAEQEAELLLSELVLADSTSVRRLRRQSRSFPPPTAEDLAMFPARNDVRRSISCVGYGATNQQAREDESEDSPPDQQLPARTPCRLKIFYRDEALRESYAKNTRRMIENAKRLHQPAASDPSGDPSATAEATAASAETLNNQQRFALKALKYRNLLDRMHEIDESRLNDPSFDVLECLGVEWCKV